MSLPASTLPRETEEARGEVTRLASCICVSAATTSIAAQQEKDRQLEEMLEAQERHKREMEAHKEHIKGHLDAHKDELHGHLAKHLRSKMHIMKLECIGKLPIGMYAEMERLGTNLNEIDTTDCENSLESLQQMAVKLYEKDPSKLTAMDEALPSLSTSSDISDDEEDSNAAPDIKEEPVDVTTDRKSVV